MLLTKIKGGGDTFGTQSIIRLYHLNVMQVFFVYKTKYEFSCKDKQKLVILNKLLVEWTLTRALNLRKLHAF